MVTMTVLGSGVKALQSFCRSSGLRYIFILFFYITYGLSAQPYAGMEIALLHSVLNYVHPL